MHLGTIWLGVRGDTKPARQDLDKLKRKAVQDAKTIEERTTRSLSSLTRHWKLYALAATAALALVGRGFLEAARTAENYQVRLKVLLGSVDKGNELFRRMAKFASGVSFEYREIMGAATNLAGVMRGGVKEISRWMPMIADLAAATGLTIQDTTSQVIRMYSAGAAAADMFRERGVLAMLGFQAGVKYTAEETRKIMFKSWQKVGSQFKDASKELAKTWDGLMGMLKDKWFQFRNIVMDAGVYDELKGALERVNVEFERWIANNKELIAQKVPEYISKIKTSLQDLFTLYQKMPEGVIGATGVGLVVRILFGSMKAGAIVGFLVYVNSELKKLGLNLTRIPRESAEVWEHIKNIFKGEQFPIFGKFEIGAALARETLAAQELGRAYLKAQEAREDEEVNRLIEERIKLLKEVVKIRGEMVSEIGLITYELRLLQLQGEAAWETYQKGARESIDYTINMTNALGLIEYELRIIQLQSEAAWAAYQKGIKAPQDHSEELLNDLGLIEYELRMVQLQGEAAWEAYQKGIQPTTDSTVALHDALTATEIALAKLQMEVEKGIEISVKGLGEEVATKEQLTAVRNMYEDMGDYSAEYFDTVNKLIDIQAAAYAKLAKDEVLADKWAKHEKKKMVQAQLQMELAAKSKMMSDYAEFFDYMAGKNREYFALYKGAAIAAAIIDTYAAAVKALATLPPPWSYAAAAAAIAAGFARVAKMRSQDYAVGGWLNTHPGGGKIGEGAGGRDDVYLGSTPGVNHWGMKDEFVFIMNKEATKRNGAMLEAMNKGMGGGGWINRGYGLLGGLGGSLNQLLGIFGLGAPSTPPPAAEDPGEYFAEVRYEAQKMLGMWSETSKLFVELTQKTEGWLDKLKELGATEEQIAEMEGWVNKVRKKFWEEQRAVVAKAMDGMNRSIADMVGGISPLEDALYRTNERFNNWIKELKDAGATHEQMAEIEEQRAKVLAHVAKEMQESFIAPLEDIIAKGTMTDLEYQLHQLSEWYEEQKKQALELGLSLDTLNEAYGIQVAAAEEAAAATAAAAEEQARAAEEAARASEKAAQAARALDLKAFTDSLQDILDRGTMTDLEYELEQIEKWYKEQYITARILGGDLLLLADAYREQIRTAEKAAEALAAAARAEEERTRAAIQAAQLAVSGMAADQIRIKMMERTYGMAFPKDIMKDIVGWFTGASAAQIQATAEAFGVTWEDLASDVEFLNGLLQEMGRNMGTVAGAAGNYNKQISDTASILEKMINAWKAFYDTLRKQILSLRTGLTSPRDILERMAVVQEEIAKITGGMPTKAFLGSLETEEERLEAVEALRNLFGQYLELSKEAYQRPSREYQAIYQRTLDELTGLEEYALDYARETYDVDLAQLDVLKEIRDAVRNLPGGTIAGEGGGGVPGTLPIPGVGIPEFFTGGIPGVTKTLASYGWTAQNVYETINDILSRPPTGLLKSTIDKYNLSKAEIAEYYSLGAGLGPTAYTVADLNKLITAGYAYGTPMGGVPKTGIYMLHEGEEVSRADTPRYSIMLNINESRTPRETGREVTRQLEGFVRGSRGRKMIQQTSIGRG